jgi:hypothetical protein
MGSEKHSGAGDRTPKGSPGQINLVGREKKLWNVLLVMKASKFF